MKNLVIILSIHLMALMSYAAAPNFYVFDGSNAQIAFCKSKPPRLFQFKKIDSEKIRSSEVIPKFEAYVADDMTPMDLDGTEMSQPGAPKKCWIFENSKYDFQILASNVPDQKSYTLFNPLIVKVKPATKLDYKIKTTSYSLNFPALDKLHADGTVRGMRPKDIVLSDKNWSCTLASVPYLDDKDGLKIVLAADFNDDALPDVIIESTAKGTDYNFVLSDVGANKCKQHKVHIPPTAD